ncbi:MAG: radA, partial [Candidatus Saccharibacteria bacterium]|nr:radA [Candidatus Saccharibacteria bacterium]
MAKSKSQFVCQNCGASYGKWSGRCENCGEWNTLVEQMASVAQSNVAKAGSSGKKLSVQSISTISGDSDGSRLSTGVEDLDIVLGGGIVPGSVTLLAGQPGIGKSTLLLQVTANIAAHASVLYVSGEESASQVAIRAGRLGADKHDKLSFASSTSANDIAATIAQDGYSLVVVDSI